jgi:hypothetical protein
MSHLLNRLGIVLGGVHLTASEQKALKATGELAVERGVTHRVYHYKVAPGGGVTISAVFSG